MRIENNFFKFLIFQRYILKSLHVRCRVESGAVHFTMLSAFVHVKISIKTNFPSDSNTHPGLRTTRLHSGATRPGEVTSPGSHRFTQLPRAPTQTKGGILAPVYF